MNNELINFHHEMFGDIRAIEKDGEPWFVGKDVAKALGYCKPENALAAHVDQEDKTIALIQGSGSNYKSNTALINESGALLHCALFQAAAGKGLSLKPLWCIKCLFRHNFEIIEV